MDTTSISFLKVIHNKRELSLVKVLNTPLYLTEFSFGFHSVLFYTGFI